MTQLDHSSNLMATRRETVTYLSAEQQARARCWLLNGAHQSFVSCRKKIRLQYNDYINDCLSTFYQTEPINGTIFIECSADPCHYINPCKNGGTCVSDYDTVSCDCTGTGYCGYLCDVLAKTVSDCPFQQPTMSPTVPSEPTDTTEPSCSSSIYGCCPDGVTVAGPYQADCHGIKPCISFIICYYLHKMACCCVSGLVHENVWELAASEYFSSFDQWKSGCS